MATLFAAAPKELASKAVKTLMDKNPSFSAFPDAYDVLMVI
jgi:hypothetical protein